MGVERRVLLVLAALTAADCGLGAPAPDDTRPSVTTAGGEVRGRWEDAPPVVGGRFAAYLGIPYATPPIGHLRFKFPKPARPWDIPLEAVDDPPVCPQINVHSVTKEVVGQEDCLYLNVYVPDDAAQAAPNSSSSPAGRPVLFVVHGGTFTQNSGRKDAFGPDFLVHGGVVVVSINYRQGPLGYLSLDTEDIPGNAGLKDLVLGLRWVRDNIAAFGGDPARITAFGWSTGASAVHLLSLQPSTRGLFSRMILMSGNAISPRAYTERHVERAQAMAAILGAKDNASHTVHRVLRDASAESLLRANDDPRMRRLGQPLPSPERRVTRGAEPKLLLQDPEGLLRRPLAPPMPTLMGVAAREGALPFHRWGLDSRSPEELDELLPRLMPADLLPGADTSAMLGLVVGPSGSAGPGPGPLDRDSALRLAQLVRNEYSGGGPIANSTDTFIEFLGDAFLYSSTWRAVGFMADASTDEAPLRLYKFLVDDAFNYAKRLYSLETPGATHVDDLGYVGRFSSQPDLQQGVSTDGVAPKILQRMTNMYTTFAKGQVASRLPQWPAVPRAASWPVLLVGPGLSLRVDHMDNVRGAARRAFWGSAYRDLRSATSAIGQQQH